MLFNSAQFCVFFAIVYLLYWKIADYRRQNLVLLAASYVFYGAWDIRFLPLMLVCTLVNFYSARGITRAHNLTQRRTWLILGVGSSLAVLAFFKYFNFGVESAQEILAFFGLQPHLSTLTIILPVGISFYTFHTISYTVDVYRGVWKPSHDLLSFALYVAYFPQLVAGPIQQSTFLLPELEKPRRIRAADLRLGFMWILLGYAKKVVLADTLAPLVDRVFEHPEAFSGATCAMAVLAFALQIYGDFAGYTLIARGISQCMGIQLIENFHLPYLATDPRDFWRRWHISLSSWLRNYLYVPLGGNRKGAVRTYVNLMTTMLLGGLWHGASWNFVIWGGYHGFLLCLGHAFGLGTKTDRPRSWLRAARVGAMFALTLFGWLLFRSRSLSQLATMLHELAVPWRWDSETTFLAVPTLSLFTILVAYHIWQERAGNMLVLLNANPYMRGFLYLLLALAIAAVGFKPVPFVYFQF